MISTTTSEQIPFWRSPTFMIVLGILAIKIYGRINVLVGGGLPMIDIADPSSVGAWVYDSAIAIGAAVIAWRRKNISPKNPVPVIETTAASVNRLTKG